MTSKVRPHVRERHKNSFLSKVTSWAYKDFFTFYEHCITNKQHKLKFCTSTANYILDLIHFHVWRALVISIEGARYFVSFLNDFFKRCWVYPIKSKACVLSVFKTFKMWLELESEKKIRSSS